MADDDQERRIDFDNIAVEAATERSRALKQAADEYESDMDSALSDDERRQAEIKHEQAREKAEADYKRTCRQAADEFNDDAPVTG
jgi:DNA repair ATPase RecN